MSKLVIALLQGLGVSDGGPVARQEAFSGKFEGGMLGQEDAVAYVLRMINRRDFLPPFLSACALTAKIDQVFKKEYNRLWQQCDENKLRNWPAGQLASRPTSHRRVPVGVWSSGQLASRPTGQPANWTAGQPANWPTGQMANRPSGEPANWAGGQLAYLVEWLNGHFR